MFFRRALTVGRLLGFPIRLDWSWFLVVLLLTWSLAGSYATLEPGFDPRTRWLMGLCASLGLFASVLLHELGHAVIARREGVEMHGITLFIFGGVAEMAREPPSAGAEFRIAIAGPVVSLLLCALGYLALPLVATLPGTAVVLPVLAYLAMINGVLVLFNMVPAFPLDGGRVLRSVLWGWRRDLAQATQITAAMGTGFAWTLIALGVFAMAAGSFISGLWALLIGLFLRSAAAGAYQQVLVQRSLDGFPVRRVMNPEAICVGGDLTLEDFAHRYALRYHHQLFPVTDAAGRLEACVTLRMVTSVPRERWRTTTIRQVERPCSPLDTVEADDDAMTVLARMEQDERSRLVVLERGRVLGILALHDLLAHIGISLELQRAGDDPAAAA